MKRTARTLLTALLVCALLMSCVSPAFAYNADKAQNQAEALKTLGLFLGTDTGFELDRAPTRVEALVMLLRMTGKEVDARFYEGEHPFTDAPDWANAYIGYAYANNLTKGVTDTSYAPDAQANAQTYVTLMLRALGYDANQAWDQWETLGKQAGLFPAGVDRENFRRGDAVLISYAALESKLQDGSMTLEEKLLADGVLSQFALACAALKTGAPVSKDSSLPLIMASVYEDVSEYLSPNYLHAAEITKENMAFYLGVDNLKIDAGLAVEPMMTAHAHSVCLIRLSDGQDVEKAKAAIKENADPRKWICVGVSPENVLVDNIGNLIILVMDNEYSDALMKNFKELPDSANGVSLVDGSAVEKKTLDAKSVENFAGKLNSIRDAYLKDNDVYYSVIPDKSYYYRNDFAGYLDHSAMTSRLSPLVDKEITEIALGNLLAASDYFKTDPHWKQEELKPVVDAFGKAMNFTVDWSGFQKKTFDSFLGSYSRSLDSLKPETLTYLTSDRTATATVSIYGSTGTSPVYDTAKLQTEDPYSLFLSGLSPLTVVENPDAGQQRHLVLFTDSFGASVAPLLLDGYSKITLVDLRFTPSDKLSDYIDFAGADVLFLYSAAMVNNSQLLR